MRRLAALLLALLTSCASEPTCPTLEPRQSLVRLDPATGAVRSLTALPAGEVTAVGRLLQVSRFGATPTPVAQVDASPHVTSPLRSAGSTLLGKGWTVPYAGGRYVGAVGDRAVVLGVDAQLRGVRARDGELEWNARLDHRFATSHAVIVGGLVVAVGGRWQQGESGPGRAVLYALDGVSGLLRWERDVGPLQGQALVRQGLRVVVGLGQGRLAEQVGEVRGYDGVTGAPLWSVALPHEEVSWLGQAGADLVAVSARYVPGCQ